MAHLLQRFGLDRQDLPDGAAPAPAVAAQGGEVGFHAGLDLADVGFGYLGPYRHGRQAGNAQDQRCALLGIEGLAFAGIHRDDRASHGGVDPGIAQFCFGAAQGCLGLADLGLVHVDPGLSGQHLGLGSLHVFVARGAVGGHALLAVQLLFGQ
ncbi:hypothetical protein D3C80_1693530 [compost metagenome]